MNFQVSRVIFKVHDDIKIESRKSSSLPVLTLYVFATL